MGRDFEIVFLRGAFKGELSMLFGATKLEMQGWKTTMPEKLSPAASHQWFHWWSAVEANFKQLGRLPAAAAKLHADADLRSRRLEKLAALVASKCYVLGELGEPRFRMNLVGGGRVIAAFTWTPPCDAKSGETFRLDVLQWAREQIIGGSSYLFVVVEDETTLESRR